MTIGMKFEPKFLEFFSLKFSTLTIDIKHYLKWFLYLINRGLFQK